MRNEPGKIGSNYQGVTLTVIAILAFGMEAAQAQEGQSGFSIGAAVVGGNSIYRGEDDFALPLPLLRYDSEAFSIGLPDGLRVNLYRNSGFELGAIATPRIFALVDPDGPYLQGIDREVTVDVGFQASYEFAPGTEVFARAVTEATDEHDGSEIELALRRSIPKGKIIFNMEAGATWQSSQLSTYMYGVRASEAVAGRPGYDPGDVVIPHLSIGAVYPLSASTRLIADIRAEFLPDEVSSSPIISDDVAIGAVLGLSYTF
ncbi:MltA-interacting protein precursor [Roseovarius sp. THAF27]|uniref:MipA/OmpV family protein n=1 Tax=Roseovarius sp. THAF27 TaxID=2587850 RepID=UPI0012682900|nr:MipA/OmpV family protein [Roseovarius sp. THAF27]QFT82009.1 MltA-interacting protein precursor [Roseovarius sp. THAF27]